MIDALQAGNWIDFFEFKLDGNAQEALAQIKRGAYFKRYRHRNKAIHLVGVNFARQLRQVTSWRAEQNVL